jgi:DNA-binding response OmpR family regulator
MKILVVDDDAGLRDLIAYHLHKAGHEVVQAEDGLAGWKLFEGEPFRMVITDWVMPELDGPGLTAKIRGANLPQYTYIIILTALDDRPSLLKGEKAGTDDYLLKPVASDELLARVVFGERILRMKDKHNESK